MLVKFSLIDSYVYFLCKYGLLYDYKILYMEICMKIVLWLLGIIVALVVGAYIVAFTFIGNAILSPIVEAKIQEQKKELQMNWLKFLEPRKTYSKEVLLRYLVIGLVNGTRTTWRFLK